MTSLLGSPLERFEHRFVPLLAVARTVPGIVEAALNDCYLDGVPGDDMPAATASRMLLAVDPLYHTAVQSLGEAETTLGALAMMRPLIEAWAHLFWIIGDDDGSDATCRAIRVERGWAGQAKGVAHESGIEREIKKADTRLDEINRLSVAAGCKGGPRGYGDTGSTVDQMAKQLNADWLPGAFRTASQMVHVGGFDWSLVDLGGGVSVLQFPTPSHRAARLNHLATLYYNVAMSALRLTRVGRDSDAARSVYRVLEGEVLANRFLQRAIDGDFD